MSNELLAFSNQMAAAVEIASQSVAAVHARPRLNSSGLIWREGLIVTADETVRHEEDIHVTLPDGQTVAATLKGRDPGTGLALLEAPGAKTGPAVFGAADRLKPGHVVLAVGRTSNTGPIASAGIISGVAGPWQTWRGGKLDQFVRLDIALYPTSVGGAVVEASGELAGIVSTGLSRTSVLALTRPTIERVAAELLRSGRVARGYLGVTLQAVPLAPQLQQTLGFSQESGIMILRLEESGSGHRSGLVIGDVLLTVNAQPVPSPEALSAALGPETVGKTIPFTILRGGKLQKLDVTVGERPGRAE